MVCPPSRSLISHFLPTCCVRLADILSPNCLPLSPHVCLCWMVGPPSQGLVSPCLPTCVSVLDDASALDGLSAFPRSCLPLSACVGWCVRLPEVLFPLVSHPPSCFPLLDGVSVFPTSCLLLSPIVCSHVRLCWMVYPLPRALVSTCCPLSPMVPSCLPVSPCVQLCAVVCHSLPTCVPVLDGSSSPPIVSPHRRLCWMVSPTWTKSAFKRPCPTLSPIVSPLPPSRGLVSFCLPLSPRMCACVGWCAPLPKVLSPLVSHCLPTCVPLSGGASAISRSCPPLVSHCLPSCFPVLMVCPPSRGFVPLVSQLVFLLVSKFVSQLVSLLLPLCGGWSDFACLSNSVLLGVVPVFLRCLPWCWMVCPPSRGLVSYLVSQLVSLLVSLCGGWSHVAFFPNSVRFGVFNAFSCHVFDLVLQKTRLGSTHCLGSTVV